MVRRGVPLSRSSVAGPGGGLLIVSSRVPRALPGRHRPSRQDRLLSGLSVHSIWVIAQQNPLSSRAAATAIRLRRLPLASRRVQVRCSRRCADHATATASGGLVALALGSALADARPRAIVPAGLDQQPAGVPGSGLRDRPEPALLPGRRLRGNHADVAHQPLGVANRSKSPISAHSPTAESVSMPRRHLSRAT